MNVELDRAAVVADFKEAMRGLISAAAIHADRTFAESMELDAAELPHGRSRDDAWALAASPDRVAEALESVTAGAPRTTRLAGSAAEGWVTYVQRSRLMGYPDAISIRLTPVAGGTRVSVFSRSRFGYGDAGVNAARVSRWMERLEAALAP